jgi:hypothetical protein
MFLSTGRHGEAISSLPEHDRDARAAVPLTWRPEPVQYVSVDPRIRPHDKVMPLTLRPT